MTRRPVTDHELLAFAADDLPEADTRRVQAFVETDAAAARSVARYRHAATTFARDDSVAPPVAVIRRAQAIFQPSDAAGPTWPERLEAAISRLVFDSRLQPSAVRSRDDGNRFQVAYEVDEAEIELRAERRGDGDQWQLIGQLAWDGPTDEIAVELVPSGGGTRSCVDADTRGVFALQITAGVYDVRLRRGDRLLVVPGLEIG